MLMSRTNLTPRIMIARSYGQLGNRLFLYGHLLAAAKEYGVTLANPCFAEYAHLFPATAGDLWCRFPVIDQCDAAVSPHRRRILSKATYLAARLLGRTGAMKSRYDVLRLRSSDQCDLESDELTGRLQNGRTLLVDGWLFRSERLFHKHADAVRKHFQIQPIHRHNVDQAIARIRQSADVIVGVHIRHGDYKTFLGGKYFYPVSQYVDLMRSVASQFSGQRVAFLVCSNAKLHPNDFDGLDVHFGPGHLVEDMYCFAECDLLIGPPSTYTLWASIYGKTHLHVMNKPHSTMDVSDMFQSKQAAA